MQSTWLRHSKVYVNRCLKFDILAGLMVFLVALPLCLGIALASDLPLQTGLISGAIGGIVVGFLSGSAVSVSGPAAGMVAICLIALNHLGSFQNFLLAMFFSGFLQILAARRGWGVLANYIPSAVIKGMICGIGVLLIAKQIPMAVTVTHNYHEFKHFLLASVSENNLNPIIDLSFHINTGAFILSLITLSTLIFLDKTKHPWLKTIPGAIAAVIVGTLINEILVIKNSILAQHAHHLVRIPKLQSLYDLSNIIHHPNWQALSNPLVYFYGLVIALVSSIETLVNISATDRLDKNHISTNKNKELFAQGIGNIVASLCGGLPITSVIIRSSVNLEAKAKTKFATMLHGLMLLIALFLTTDILNRIPICILASILIYVGFKLTHPRFYIMMFNQGIDRAVPFLVTVIVVSFGNLLAGILTGLMVNLLFVLRNNSRARINILQESTPGGSNYRLLLPQQTTFLNKATMIEELNTIPRNSKLIIDARYAEFIDKEVIEYIQDYKEFQAPLRNISLNLIGFKEKYQIHDHIDFINVTTYDAQSVLSPSEVLQILVQGNQRFLKDQGIHRSNMIDIHHTAETQHPIAFVLGCIDSRVPVETIFDMTLGDLFCARIAGNVINDDILASIEYACHVVGAKLIVILGHTRCGAIQAACNDVKKGHITTLLAKINPAINAESKTKNHRQGDNLEFVNHVTHLNVAYSMLEIYERSPILKEMLDQGQIGMVGALYNVSSGQVHFSLYQQELKAFENIEASNLLNTLKNLEI